MAYSTVLDHFRAVQAWTSSHRARAELDMNTLQLQVYCANRYFLFYPRFGAITNGQLVHLSTLTESSVIFGGWLPYQVYTTELSTDKLLFKQYLSQAGIRTPRIWQAGEVPDMPHITKPSRGSFGYGIAGPFLPNEFGNTSAPPQKHETLFAEQFIVGKIVKLWLWGGRAFFAEMQDYPRITGDGITSAGELARIRIAVDSGAGALVDASIVQTCLAFQGLGPDDIPSMGQTYWIDFRYGRSFQDRRQAGKMVNELATLQAQCGDQLAALQEAVAKALKRVATAPLACTVDGVLDEQGQLWWLELNSNPLFPHHGYETMFNDLFGQPAVSPVSQAPMKP
jgi:hypothetical protein